MTIALFFGLGLVLFAALTLAGWVCRWLWGDD